MTQPSSLQRTPWCLAEEGASNVSRSQKMAVLQLVSGWSYHMQVLGDDRLVEVRTPFLRRNDVEEPRTMFGHCRFVSPRFATCLVEDGSAAPACSTFRKPACLSSRCGIPRHPSGLAVREDLCRPSGWTTTRTHAGNPGCL